MPKPSRAISAMRRPIVPTPRMPSVDPLSSVRPSARGARRPSLRRAGGVHPQQRPAQMHQRRHHILGHRVGVAARQVGDRNAARGGGGDRDEVEADAVADDALQARRMIDDVVGQFGAHDDAVGIRRPLRARFPAARRAATIMSTCGARIASPSGCIALVSRTIGLSGIWGRSFDDRILQAAEALDLDFDGRARLEPRRRLVQRGHAGRCAGRDDVAGLERLQGGQIGRRDRRRRTACHASSRTAACGRRLSATLPARAGPSLRRARRDTARTARTSQNSCRDRNGRPALMISLALMSLKQP